jgi:hypothetical protein
MKKLLVKERETSIVSLSIPRLREGRATAWQIRQLVGGVTNRRMKVRHHSRIHMGCNPTIVVR